MIVFVAGMQRSGSTFCFNVVREVLKRSGSLHFTVAPGITKAAAEYPQCTHLILKDHSASEETIDLVRFGGIKAICSIRKPEDAIASWMERFGFSLDKSIEDMRTWLEVYRKIRPHALTIPYDMIDRSPMATAWKISKYVDPHCGFILPLRLGWKYRKASVKRMTDSISKDDPRVVDAKFTIFNIDNFFHRSHVSSIESIPAVQRIGPENVAKIREALGPFLDKDGYVL